ncbi:MAG: PstS family phosphate ABC transporter substrate-binding protein [Desulfamplus sp.]|nr:PstS family phosphate ABC transporter substrate-binding protein [Desulfamplus sp.]
MKGKTFFAGLGVAAALTIGAATFNSNAIARDYITVVGSSTVYPFATVVAEQFGKTSGFKTPKIESTGTGGGMKLFCSGVGVQHPDIANASRRIKKSECETCDKNGVKEIIEFKVGYDGIVLGASKKSAAMNITRKDLFLALAANVPEPSGAESLVPNPYKTWKDINPSLPANKIEVLGPPPTSGTRDAFLELVMEVGGSEFAWIKALEKADKDKFKSICHTIREDGAYVEAGENDNLIVQKLDANSNAFGIFGFSFLDQNADKIQGTSVEGIAPTFEAIADGKYTVSRPLYLYVKKAHVDVIPGMKEYLKEFSSEKAWGEDGYLSEKGLIPMPEDERKSFSNDVQTLKALPCGDL